MYTDGPMEKPIRTDELLNWREAVKKEVALKQELISQAQKKLVEYQERLELIDQLIQLENSSMEKMNKSVTTNSYSDNLVEECVAFLRQVGKPMHIADIHGYLLKKGIALPGKGNEANVISRIQRSQGKIVRTGRGVYGLAELGAVEVKPSKKRKVSRVNK